MRKIVLTVFLAALVLGMLAVVLFQIRKGPAIVELGGVSILIEIVDDHLSRVRGLSGRENLPENNGMLFVFDSRAYHSIWMKDMKFPIDIIWIGDSKVVDLAEGTPVPEKNTADSVLPLYRPGAPAEFVLEVNAGFVKKHNIQIGDSVGLNFQ